MLQQRHGPRKNDAGFTLVELLIVIVVILSREGTGNSAAELMRLSGASQAKRRVRSARPSFDRRTLGRASALTQAGCGRVAAVRQAHCWVR